MMLANESLEFKYREKRWCRILDIYAEAGAGFTALQRNYMVEVDEKDDNSIRIEFIHKTEKPTIAGLEVHGIRYIRLLL